MTLTIFAIARLQALSMGGSVIRACKSQNPAFAQRQSACRHLGELLSHSSDYVSDIIGLVVWRDAAAGAAERLELERRISRLKWLMFHALNLLQSGEPTLTERFLDVLAQGSEVRGVEALLAAHGLPTQPPADWVENAAHRHARTSHASR